MSFRIKYYIPLVVILLSALQLFSQTEQSPVSMRSQEKDRLFSGAKESMHLKADTIAFIVDVTKANVTCNGYDNGSIEASGSGGYPPYTFEWTLPGGELYYGNSLVNLNPGIYALFARDSLNNVYEQIISISEPAPLISTVVIQDATCYGATNGVILGEVAGGIEPYTYTLNGVAVPDFEMTSLPKGDYQIRITDSNGCETGNLAFVGEILVECLRIPTAFTPNGDGVNDEWQIENIDMYADWQVVVFNRWGQKVYEATTGNDPWDGKSETGSFVSVGNYLYIINSPDLPEARTGYVSVIF